ncbi:GlsB/YeaQ/YmgE family stress response membrane protein [Streptomyces sp. NPDC088197]|uniref:GlsB/YeaQ/YmgE family stress response membrane protein n=1 Tax=unclassified Streptomyces TaxID=2593676 RepID=UPI0036E6C032
MGIISWVILGLLAGAVAKILLPGRDPGGLIGTTLIGVAGAFVGGWLSAKILDKPVQHHFFDAATWGAAIGGALVLLILYRIFFGDSRDARR